MSTEYINKQLDLVLSDESLNLSSKKTMIMSLMSAYTEEAIDDFISRNTKASKEDFEKISGSIFDDEKHQNGQSTN